MSAVTTKRGSGSFSLTKPEIRGVDARAKFHGFRNRGDYLRALVQTDLKIGLMRFADNEDGRDILLPTEEQWSKWSDEGQLAGWRKRNAIGRKAYEDAVAIIYDMPLPQFAAQAAEEPAAYHTRAAPKISESHDKTPAAGMARALRHHAKKNAPAQPLPAPHKP